MFVKKIWPLAIFLFFLLGGLGCKGLSSEEQAAVSPETLEYWTVNGNVNLLRQKAAEYIAIRPHITVNIRQVRKEDFEKAFLNALADDAGPDIISINAREIKAYESRISPMPAFVNMARMVVKGQYMKETTVERFTVKLPTAQAVNRAYVSAVGEDAIINGQVYGLPLVVDTLALYYNKDLLDKAGVAVPPANWDEFLKAAQKSTKFNATGEIIQSGAALGTSKNIDNFPFVVSALLMQSGNRVVKDGASVLSSGLDRVRDTHPTLEALRFYTNFAQPTTEAYSWNEKMENAFDSFVRGKSVFYFGFASEREKIAQRAPAINLEVLPLPQLSPDTSPANAIDYYIEAVVKKSVKQDAAWDFINFISAPDKILQYANTVGLPSPLREHIGAQSENPMLNPFVSQILIAKNWYSGNDAVSAEKALGNMISGLLQPYGEKQNPVERDIGLIVGASRVIQQTL